MLIFQEIMYLRRTISYIKATNNSISYYLCMIVRGFEFHLFAACMKFLLCLYGNILNKNTLSAKMCKANQKQQLNNSFTYDQKV